MFKTPILRRGHGASRRIADAYRSAEACADTLPWPLTIVRQRGGAVDGSAA